MKTYRKSAENIAIQKSRILKTILLLFALLLLNTGTLVARGKKVKEKQVNPKVGIVSGFVVDDEFGEPIEKAVVTIPGTRISVLTDQQGKYELKLVGGDYFIEVNHPDYYGKKYNMSVSGGIFTPMFIVKLKSKAIGRIMQRKISSLERKHELPQIADDFSTWKVTEQNGQQEFNQLFREIPSVSFFSNGSGYNDSEIRFRGNVATGTNYSLNGILLNNPETGQVHSSALSGLTDWAGQIQLINGQPASLQSQVQAGGLINVLSLLPNEEAGAEILAIYGNSGMMKTGGTVHSGLSKKGLASVFRLSRTSGDGLAENTGFEQYSLFAGVQKEFNHRHTLVLNLALVQQKHDRNAADTVGAYNYFGTKYNASWGILNEQPNSWSTGFERSPMISLTHFWQPRVKTHVTTQLVARVNWSAQLKPGGLFNNQPISIVPRDSVGRVQFDQIFKWNQGNDIAEMGSTRKPDANGQFENTEFSGITTLASIDSENRLGFRSVISHQFSKKFDVSASFDLEDYRAKHFGAVHDLLGATAYTSYSDLNRTEGFPVGNLFQDKLIPKFNSVDPAGYFYESTVQSGGINLRIDYQTKQFNWLLAGSASVKNLQRTDHFNYLATDPDRKTEFVLLPGGNIQTGGRLKFGKYHSIHVRTGYGSYQPFINSIFPTANNWRNPNTQNEQVFDSEAGYTIFSRKLKVEALAYRTAVWNRTDIRKSLSSAGYSLSLINGLNEIRQGIELKTSYKITKNLQFYLNGGYGDWKYSGNATARQLDDLTTNETVTLPVDKVYVDNAPQFILFAEAEYRWAHNFYVRLNYYRADRIYAPFQITDLEGLTDFSDFTQWKLPAYQLLGASGNYLVKIRKLGEFNFIFGGNNLLDSEYIEQSMTNIPEGQPGYTSNLVHYGTGRTWFAGIKMRF